MNRTTKIGAAIAAGGVAVLAAAAIAMASPISEMASGDETSPNPMTHAVTQQVTDAAAAAVPGGTVTEVEAKHDGTYEAEVTNPDGTEVEVEMDATFTVTSIDKDGDHGDSDDVPLTGADAEKVTAAALAAVPGGTVVKVEGNGDGTFDAHVTNPDGTQVEVEMDATFTVTSIDKDGDHDGSEQDLNDTETAPTA